MRQLTLISLTLRLFSLAAVCSAAVPAGAQEQPKPSETSVAVALDGLSQVQVTNTSPFVVGDGINSADLSAPRQRCITYQKSDIQKDTQGAVSSSLHTSLIRDIDDLATELKFNYSVSASANVNIASLLSGESSINNTGRFEGFFHNQRQTMEIVVDASANHGRSIIGDYELKPEYKVLIAAKNYDEFIRQCGTHFIRGESRKSTLRVAFKMSDLDRQARTLIESSFRTSAKGSLGIDSLTAGAQAELSSTLSATLSLASKVGNASLDAEATGGAGIASLGKVLTGLQVTNVSDLDKLVAAMISASADFTADNSAPDQFIVVPYPQLPGVAKFDSVRFEALGGIYKKLLRVDSALDEYKIYQKQDPVLWGKYFRIYQEKLDALRSQLISAYRDCRSGQSCDTSAPVSVDGLFLDDILTSGDFSAKCLLSSQVTQSLNQASPIDTSILSSITMVYKSRVRFIDELDIQGTEAYRITPDLKREKIDFRPKDKIRIWGGDDNEKEFYAIPYYVSVDYRPIIKNNQIDYGALSEIRTNAARSIYVLKFFFTNGRSEEEVLGYPNMKGCTLLDEK